MKKTIVLFWILVVLVFGSLIISGYQFLKLNHTIFLLMESVAAISIILFILFYKILIKPFQLISDGMDLIRQQDFSSQLRPVGNKDADRMIDVFNKMLEQLREERLHVREQNRFLDLLINASPLGLIVLDLDEKISQINPVGIQLLGVERSGQWKGKTLAESGIRMGKSLAALGSGEEAILRGPGIMQYRCIRSSFIDRGFAHPFILIEELTYELLKAEKKSYENIIRMMAHEVNNSVAAIGSTLDVISVSLKQDKANTLSDVLPAVDASFDRCNHLGRFISNFSEMVKIPAPQRSDVDLNQLMRSVEALCRVECNQRAIRLTLSLSETSCLVKADEIQLEQVLVNLVKNAYESIERGGEIRLITQSHPIKIRVEDDGPGIPEAVSTQLFTPFFSTKPQGQGIGLMFVREVLTNHQCSFSFGTEKNGKTVFCIENFEDF